jgi:hypothetical protein
MDIGFRKRKVDILKKQGRLALRPLRAGRGRAGSCRKATLPNLFVVGQFEFTTIAKKSWPKAQA